MPRQTVFPNVNTTFRTWINPRALPETEKRIAGGMIEYAQEVVAYAKRNHPYQDRTGVNTRSIAWGVALRSGQQVGTVPSGTNVGGSLLNAAEEGRFMTVSFTTSSGYGGYLETGTSKMRAFPYIVPAIQANRATLKRRLTGVV